MAMKLKQCSFVAYGLIGAMSIGLVSACQSANQAGESEFNKAMNACERMDRPDEREQCVDAAMAKQQTAIQKAMTSIPSCPKGTC